MAAGALAIATTSRAGTSQAARHLSIPPYHTSPKGSRPTSIAFIVPRSLSSFVIRPFRPSSLCPLTTGSGRGPFAPPSSPLPPLLRNRWGAGEGGVDRGAAPFARGGQRNPSAEQGALASHHRDPPEMPWGPPRRDSDVFGRERSIARSGQARGLVHPSVDFSFFGHQYARTGPGLDWARYVSNQDESTTGGGVSLVKEGHVFLSEDFRAGGAHCRRTPFGLDPQSDAEIRITSYSLCQNWPRMGNSSKSMAGCLSSCQEPHWSVV